jgi:hypothetical protein
MTWEQKWPKTQKFFRPLTVTKRFFRDRVRKSHIFPQPSQGYPPKWPSRVFPSNLNFWHDTPIFKMTFFIAIFISFFTSCTKMTLFCKRFFDHFYGPKKYPTSILDHVSWKGILRNCFCVSGNAGRPSRAEKWHFCARLLETSKIIKMTKNHKKPSCKKWPFLRKSHFSLF